jgi:hypothetical protein
MAKRGIGGRGRGRTLVAVMLAAFLVVSSSVIWRRASGSAHARTLQRLAEQAATLETERAKLVGEIRRATSRASLTPAAQRLGLRMPSDSQVIDLPRAREQR